MINLFCGDAIQEMGNYNSGDFDVIVTSCPYNMGKDYGDFKDKVVEISGKIAGNTTLFATPSPTVLVVDGHIADMETEQANIGLGVPGSVAARDNAVQVVVEDVARKWLAEIDANQIIKKT